MKVIQVCKEKCEGNPYHAKVGKREHYFCCENGFIKSLEDFKLSLKENASENNLMNDAALKYGWTTNLKPDGTIDLINRNGTVAANVKINSKKSSYLFSDLSGKKLLSGNSNIAEAVEKIIRDYFYAKPIKDK